MAHRGELIGLLAILVSFLGPALAMRSKATLKTHARSAIAQSAPEKQIAAAEAKMRAMGMEDNLKAGIQMVSDTRCENIPQAMVNTLNFAARAMPGVTVDATNASDAAMALASVVMLADEKLCLRATMNHARVQQAVEGLQGDETALRERSQRLNQTFAYLDSMQDGLVSEGTSLLDREKLFPYDFNYIPNCPQPCQECTRKHNSWWNTEEERLKFKCTMAARHRNDPPSKFESRIQCETPRRRMWRFWQFKTWCTVPEWRLLAFQQANVGGMLTCTSFSVLGMLKHGERMSPAIRETCVKVQQRMAVLETDLIAFENYMQREPDDAVGEHDFDQFLIFMTIALADGLSGLRTASEGNLPPTPEELRQILAGDNYTNIPPEVVHNVPCDPPDYTLQVFMGVVKTVAAGVVVAAAFLGNVVREGFRYVAASLAFLAAAWPLTLWLAVWYGIMGMIVAMIGPAAFFLPHMYVGVFVFPLLVELGGPAFSSVFSGLAFEHWRPDVSWSREEEPQDCPAGIMLLPRTAPICLKNMKFLDSASYECPNNRSQRVTVSCTENHDGAWALDMAHGCI